MMPSRIGPELARRQNGHIPTVLRSGDWPGFSWGEASKNVQDNFFNSFAFAIGIYDQFRRNKINITYGLLWRVQVNNFGIFFKCHFYTRSQSTKPTDQLRKTASPDLVPVSVINKAVLGGKICDEELRREDDHQTDLIIVLLVPEYVPLLEDARVLGQLHKVGRAVVHLGTAEYWYSHRQQLCVVWYHCHWFSNGIQPF